MTKTVLLLGGFPNVFRLSVDDESECKLRFHLLHQHFPLPVCNRKKWKNSTLDAQYGSQHCDLVI